MNPLTRVALGALIVAACIPALAIGQAATDEWLKKPVDDRTFKTYLDFFTYDRKVPLDVRIIGTQQQEGITREHLSFQSTPGVRVFAYLFQPAGGSPKTSSSVIILHGGGANGKNGPVGLANNLARMGFNVLSIDMQYFGERATDLLTTFTEQEKHERLYNQQSAYLAWVAQTVKDVGRSYDFLVQDRGLDPKRIGLWGASRGGIVGSIAAGADQRLAAVVLSYVGHFDALERAHAPAACPANFIGRIAPRPLLMLNGLSDTDMLKEPAVDPLFALARQPKTILWSEGGHGQASEETRATSFRWLRDNLK